jgi:hypothetical protein
VIRQRGCRRNHGWAAGQGQSWEDTHDGGGAEAEEV